MEVRKARDEAEARATKVAESREDYDKALARARKARDEAEARAWEDYDEATT